MFDHGSISWACEIKVRSTMPFILKTYSIAQKSIRSFFFLIIIFGRFITAKVGILSRVGPKLYQRSCTFSLLFCEQNPNHPFSLISVSLDLAMTQVGCLALFSRITSGPLYACSWLLIVPFTASAVLLESPTLVSLTDSNGWARLSWNNKLCHFKYPLKLFAE